jgi:MFS family permease
MVRLPEDRPKSGGDPPVSDVQQSALRKTAYRLVPLLTLAYVFNYLDRTCLGFAALTMNRDIGLSAEQFGLGAGLFFATYCIFEIPSNLALHRFGARRWIARIMITWGLVSAATALATGPTSFYTVRLLLGIAEAGFFPGVAYYLAAWFPQQQRSRMLAWFLLAIPVSSLVGGPICGALLQMDGLLGLAGWQWLFIMVSVPCIVLGVATFFMLADRPQDASWLSADESAALLAMLAAEQRERPRGAFWEAIRDVRVLLLAAIQFGFTLASYGIGIWLPLIIKGYHLSNLAIGFLSAVPYVFASIGMILWARRVDRHGGRITQLTVTCLLGALGLGGAVFTGALAPSMVALTISLIGVTAARAIFWVLPTRFLTGVAAAGGLAFINSIGTLGGFAGPYMMGWLKDATSGYVAGLLVMAVVMLAAAALSASLRRVMTQD